MSSIQLNYYSNSDVSLIDVMNTLDGNFIGHHQLSLTNYDNTSLPAIAAGSIVENNGALFKFSTETAISGSPSDGTVYIYLVPSGDPALGTAIVTPTFTNTAPTWSDSKQGYYGTSGSANYRYLDFIIIKASTSYIKSKYFNKTMINATLTTTTLVGAGSKIINISSKTLDYNSELDLSTDTITFKISGSYKVFFSAYVTCTASTNSAQIYLYKNGSAYKQISLILNNTTRQIILNNIEVMGGGETLSFYIHTQLSDVTTDVSSSNSCICIEQIA